jgi:hypothetical protein
MPQTKLFLLFLLLGLASCGESGIYGTGGRSSQLPRLNSSFVYDYEQTIIPVKPQDEDTTYRFDVTAKISRDQVTSGQLEGCIDVNMFDMNGIDMGIMMYRLGIDEYGDINYIQPQFTDRWTRLPITSRTSIAGPDTVIGQPNQFYQEIRQKTTYLGMEIVAVGTEQLSCEKIQWEQWIKESDEYGGMGMNYEKWTYWYSRDLGFFAQRESYVDNQRMHSIRWKYTTKEKLKSYNVVK